MYKMKKYVKVTSRACQVLNPPLVANYIPRHVKCSCVKSVPLVILIILCKTIMGQYYFPMRYYFNIWLVKSIIVMFRCFVVIVMFKYDVILKISIASSDYSACQYFIDKTWCITVSGQTLEAQPSQIMVVQRRTGFNL